MLINKHTNLGSQIGPPPYVSLAKTYSIGTVLTLAALVAVYYAMRK